MPQIQVLPSVPSFGNRLAKVLGEVGEDFSQAIQKKQARTALDKLLNPQEQQQPPADGKTPTMPGTPKPSNSTTPPGLNFAKAGQIYDLAEKAFGKEQADIMAKAFIEEQKLSRKEHMAITAEERKAERDEKDKLDKLQADIIAGQESAEVSDANLNRMEAVLDSDQVIGPLGAYLTELLQVPVSLTSGADTEEFQKLAAQRGLNVATAYGFGRILQTEFTEFLKTIPSLLNSHEGKERIIKTLRYFDNIAKSRYENYRELLGERRPGERAGDLQLKLSERMKPEYKKFSEILTYGDELVDMVSPEGTKGRVPRNQVDQALADKYTLAETK
jgi:hypothetical protein